MQFIFVRHGETDWNVTLQYQGFAPIPLNDRGRMQAARVAERLRAQSISALYASDLPRAWETAGVLGEAIGVPPVAVPDLREIDVGQWEGLTPEDLHERFPAHMAAYERDPANTVRLGGESYTQLQQRAVRAFRWMEAQHHAGDTIVAVSHGGTIRAIVCDVIGLELRYFGRMWLDNGGLCVLQRRKEHWRLLRLNDAAHLEDLAREGGE